VPRRHRFRHAPGYFDFFSRSILPNGARHWSAKVKVPDSTWHPPCHVGGESVRKEFFVKAWLDLRAPPYHPLPGRGTQALWGHCGGTVLGPTWAIATSDAVRDIDGQRLIRFPSHRKIAETSSTVMYWMACSSRCLLAAARRASDSASSSTAGSQYSEFSVFVQVLPFLHAQASGAIPLQLRRRPSRPKVAKTAKVPAPGSGVTTSNEIPVAPSPPAASAKSLPSIPV